MDNSNDKKTNLIIGVAVVILLLIIIQIELSSLRKENFESGHLQESVK